GPPRAFKNGMSSRHPPAAPARSKKYARSTRSIASEITSDTTAPARKNGAALARYTSASVTFPKSFDRERMNHNDPTTQTAFAAASVPSLAYRFPRHPATTYEKTPPAPSPNRATEIARNAK